MAVFSKNPSAPGYGSGLEMTTDTRAMTVATTLFFMVGFLTCLNDIIIPHLKAIFELNYAEAMMVQFAFFTSYFLFSYPAGTLVERLGYKQTMIAGLLTMAAGAAGFVPASFVASFPVFLGALIVLAAGMVIVQVSVNPYVTVIGPAATASSRLNLAQAFSSVGAFIAPFFGSFLILRHIAARIQPSRLHSLPAAVQQSYRAAQASSVRLPYVALALALLILALALGLIKLRTTSGVSQHTQDFRPGAFAEAFTRRTDSIWSHRWLLFGALGIFTYVGAEVAIGSFLVNYLGLPQIAGLPEATAANFLPVYWGGAMIGRFLGSAILQKVRTGLLLGAAAVCAFVLVMITMHTHGTGQVLPLHLFGHTLGLPRSAAMWSVLAIGLFNSIMFPSIFTLGIQDLGSLTSKGSSLMIAAVLGGAIIPELMGRLADHVGVQAAFILPSLCYVYIAAYGIAAIRRPAGSNNLLPLDD